jgi:hypothetical protein
MIVQFSPVGPMERLLVDRIVHSAWRLRRIGRIEVEMFDFLRHPPEKKPDKSVALLRVEPGKVRACPDSSHGNRHLRFATFAEAMTAWNESEDGILCKQNKWPSDPGCPSPSDSFASFIRQPKQPEPQDHRVDLPDAVDRARAKTDSEEYIAKLDEPAELQSNAQPSDPLLTLGRTFADDLQGSGVLTRLSRYESNIERSMFKNLRQLQYVQSQRAHGLASRTHGDRVELIGPGE